MLEVNNWSDIYGIDDKWRARFFEMAQLVATWSKDPRTKVGAVIVDDHRRIVGLGYNGFPRGVKDEPTLYADRAEKHNRVVHAEANAILNSIADLEGLVLFSTLLPCRECAKLIIQAGIAVVFALRAHEEGPDLVALDMLDQAGVEVCAPIEEMYLRE